MSEKGDRNSKQNAKRVKGSKSSSKTRKRRNLEPLTIIQEKQRRKVDRLMNKTRAKKKISSIFNPTQSSTPLSKNRKSLHFSRQKTADKDETESMASSSNIDNQTDQTRTNESETDEQLSASVVPETHPHDSIIPETQDSDIPVTQDVVDDSLMQAQMTQSQLAESQDNISNISAQPPQSRTPIRSQSKVSKPSNDVPKRSDRSADSTSTKKSKTTAAKAKSAHESDPTSTNRKKTTKPKGWANDTTNPLTRSKSKTKQSTATEEEENEPANDVTSNESDNRQSPRNRTANGYLSIRQSLLNAKISSKAENLKLKTPNAVHRTELVISNQNDPESEPPRKKHRSQTKTEQSIDEPQNNTSNETNKRRSQRSRNVSSDYILRQSLLQSPFQSRTAEKRKSKTANVTRHAEHNPKKSDLPADLALVEQNLNKISEKKSMAPSERPKGRQLRSIHNIHENYDNDDETVQSIGATKTDQSNTRTDDRVYKKNCPTVDCETDNHGHDNESRTSNGMVQKEPTSSHRKKNTKPEKKTNAKNPPTQSKSKIKQSKATEDKENEPPDDVILHKMDNGKSQRKRASNIYESIRQCLLNAPAKAEKRKSKTANLHRKEPVAPFQDDPECEPPRKKLRSQSQIEHRITRAFSTSVIQPTLNQRK